MGWEQLYEGTERKIVMKNQGLSTFLKLTCGLTLKLVSPAPKLAIAFKIQCGKFGFPLHG